MTLQMESGGKDRNPRPRLTPSVSRGRAPVVCPICNHDDDDAVAEVEEYRDEWGSRPSLADFYCPRGCSLNDLNATERSKLANRAAEWCADGMDAMESYRDDMRYDSYRDDGI